MTLGVHVTSLEAPPSRGANTNTGQWFVVGPADEGPVTAATRVRSLADFTRAYGARSAANDKLYDAVDVYLREGGASAYVAREVGPGAAKATVNIPGASGTSIVATAMDPGGGANGLKATATASGSGFVLTVLDASGATLATSGVLTSKTVAPSFVNPYVAFTAGAGSATPTLGATQYTLAGGASDAANVNDSTLAAALALFPRSLGPGQVSAPGRVGAGPYGALFSHAEANNRWAVVDVTDTGDFATLAALPAAVPAGLESHGAPFGPSYTCPGPGGTTRTVPASAVVAALCARVDASGNPNQAAAGRDLALRYVTGLTQTFSDDDHDALLNLGINLGKDVYGVLENYGFQTVLTQDEDPVFWQANRGRTRMYITAQALARGESYMFKDIDGRGLLATAWGEDIASMLADLYAVGALYGDTPAAAYRVDTGPTVNTPESIAAGVLKAVASVRISPHAKDIELELVSVPTTQNV
jgi:hypothetical protein